MKLIIFDHIMLHWSWWAQIYQGGHFTASGNTEFIYIVYVLLLKPNRNYHLSVFAFMVKATDRSVWKTIKCTVQTSYITVLMVCKFYGVHLEKTGYGISYLIKCLAQVFLPTTTRFCHFRHWNVDGEGTQLSEVSRINGIVYEAENCTMLLEVLTSPLLGNGSYSEWVKLVFDMVSFTFTL